MARAAAGLGADLVRDQQEEMTAAVWDQFTAYQEADRQQRRQQLSTIVENQVKGRLEQAPIEQASRVLGPVVAQAVARGAQRRPAHRRRAANHQQDLAYPGRTVNDGQQDLRRAPARTGTPVPGAPAVRADRSPAAQPGAARLLGIGRRAVRTWREPGFHRRPCSRGSPPPAASPDPPSPSPPRTRVTSEIGGTPPPLADTQAILAPGDTTYRGNRFAPRLATPLAEILADRFRALLLPSTAQIAPDSLLGVEVDRSFVEAFLVGANQELNRELLWRGLPADPRATAFRRFWNRTDRARRHPVHRRLAGNGRARRQQRPGGRRRPAAQRDRPPLPESHRRGRAGGLGRRRQAPTERRSRRADGMPVIRTLVGDDLLYVGFAGLTLTALIGGTDPSGPAG